MISRDKVQDVLRLYGSQQYSLRAISRMTKVGRTSIEHIVSGIHKHTRGFEPNFAKSDRHYCKGCEAWIVTVDCVQCSMRRR